MYCTQGQELQFSMDDCSRRERESAALAACGYGSTDRVLGEQESDQGCAGTERNRQPTAAPLRLHCVLPTLTRTTTLPRGCAPTTGEAQRRCRRRRTSSSSQKHRRARARSTRRVASSRAHTSSDGSICAICSRTHSCYVRSRSAVDGSVPRRCAPFQSSSCWRRARRNSSQLWKVRILWSLHCTRKARETWGHRRHEITDTMSDEEEEARVEV